MANNTMLGCALVGPGNFGRGLIKALLEDRRARLMGVLGASAEESAQGAAALGGKPFANLDELLRDERVQAVFIATPSHTHRDLAVAAAQAGKHIFVEKPMALTVAECDAMIQAADDAGVTLMVGQLQRLFPLLAETRRLVQSGVIGRPVGALMRRHEVLQRQAGSWLQCRASVGGLLHQSSVHEIDWLRTTFGEVEEVFARAGAATIQDGLDFPDAAEMNFRFRNGIICALTACMTSYVWNHDGVINGTEGSIGFSINQGTLEWKTKQGKSDNVVRDEYRHGHGIAMRQELHAFLDTVLDGASVLIPGSEGRANIEVIQAALISMVERRPVSLPLPASEWARRPYLEL